MSVDTSTPNRSHNHLDVPSATSPVTNAAPRAHAFFWRVLITAAALSITGNATHAILHSPEHVAISAAVAVVPPGALLAAVHGVGVLLQAHTTARVTYLLATGMTFVIAIAAFRLSFSALSALALSAGVPSNQTWLLPLIVEGSTAQATVALLALAHAPTSHTHTAPAPDDADPFPVNKNENTLAGSHSGADSSAVRAHAPSDPDGTYEGVCTPAVGKPPTRHWQEIATVICDRDPARRRDPVEVAAILALHYDDGWTPTEISRETGRSRSTVSRIISDAIHLDAV